MYVGLSGKDKCAECGNDRKDMYGIQLFSAETTVLLCRKCMVRLGAMVAKKTASNSRSPKQRKSAKD